LPAHGGANATIPGLDDRAGIALQVQALAGPQYMVGSFAAPGQPDPAVDDRQFARPGADLDRLPCRQTSRERPRGMTGA
jgi:hypothetical protein